MNAETTQAQYCPICGNNNNCGNLSGKAHGTCWCSKETFPEGIFELVPPYLLRKACICRNCLNKYKEQNSMI